MKGNKYQCEWSNHLEFANEQLLVASSIEESLEMFEEVQCYLT